MRNLGNPIVVYVDVYLCWIVFKLKFTISYEVALMSSFSRVDNGEFYNSYVAEKFSFWWNVTSF